MKNLVVVGGGTAGWLTALYAKESFPDENIILIESEELGILGAGEGSVPNLLLLLDYLNIPLSEIIKHTNATIKNGVRFTNWSEKNKFYYSGLFADNFSILGWDSSDLNILYGGFNFSQQPSLANFISFAKNENILEYDFVAKICEENRVPMIFNQSVLERNPIFDFDRLSNISLHFDARALADFLSKIGQDRGIQRIEGKVNNIFADENGEIKYLQTNTNLQINTDFVFDCTGFFRLIIGKFYKSKWISVSDQLPMKKAMPFFVENNTDDIKPYSEAIAMNYGWMWKIPLQHRTGCGYVFDTDYINEDQAKEEIEKFVGHEIHPPKIFNFTPGYFESIWINNCLAVGLSSAFMEPMEATSIWQAIGELQIFFSQKQLIFDKNKKYIELFNKRYCDEMKDVVDFLYLHYITDKTNNKFWTDFTKNNKMSDKLQTRLFLMNESILVSAYADKMFGADNYYAVAAGNNILNYKNIKKIYDENNLEQFLNLYKRKNYMKEKISKTTVKHTDFLNYMKGIKK